MPPSITDLLDGAVALPSPPAVYLRLTQVLGSPHWSTDEVAAVLATDTGLTARLLRLVNSPYYGLSTKIETVPQAVTIVGAEEIHDLALATSVIQSFRDIPSDLVNLDAFWKHSLGCGVIARVMASHKQAPKVERFFVAGLLHDVGRLIIYQQNPSGARSVLEEAALSGDLLYVLERSAFGYDHAAVGRVLVSQWGLPESLEEPVAYHHQPLNGATYPVEAAIVHVADITAHALQLGSSGERYIPPLVPQAWDLVDLEESAIPEILADAEQHYDAAVGAILQ